MLDYKSILFSLGHSDGNIPRTPITQLKTKHISEKRLLQCDLMLMKKVMKTMSEKIKETNVSNII